MLNPGDNQRPKVMVKNRVVTKIDGSGKSSEFPTRARGASSTVSLSGTAGAADLTMRLNQHLALNHKNGRTSLDFAGDGINYNFILGELFGEEVSGMPKPQAKELGAEAARRLDAANTKMSSVCNLYSTLKVDPSQKDTKP